MTRQLCYRGVVNTWECDEMGHMNVRFYLGKAHQGLGHVGAALDLGPRSLAAMGAELVIDEQHIRFLRELHAGADLSIEAGLVEISEGRMTVYQEILPLAASHVSATLTSSVSLRDCKTGERMALPKSVTEKAVASMTQIPDHGKPRTLSPGEAIAGDSADHALEMGHIPVCLASVRSDQVDAAGFLYPDQYIGYISDGVGNLFGLLTKDLDDAMYERSETTGGAALEYHFEFLKRARAGDTLKVLSAPCDIQEKIYTLGHVIVDGETGEVFARANSVHLSFDLKTRKSLPVPPLLRRGLEAHLVCLD